VVAEKSIRVLLRGAGIRVMEAAQDGGSPHAAVRRRPTGTPLGATGDPLRQALVRSVAVEVPDILAENASQVRLAQDEEMIQAFPPHAAQEPLARRVLSGARYAVRSSMMPLAVATRANATPYLWSLSRMR